MNKVIKLKNKKEEIILNKKIKNLEKKIKIIEEKIKIEIKNKNDTKKIEKYNKNKQLLKKELNYIKKDLIDFKSKYKNNFIFTFIWFCMILIVGLVFLINFLF